MPLHMNDPDLVQCLFTEVEVMVTLWNRTHEIVKPLVKAVKYNNIHMVKNLLDAGANVNEVSLLHLLGFYNSRLIPVTPLAVAVNQQNYNICELLFNYNCNVNAYWIYEKKCYNALREAVKKSLLNMVIYLVEKRGADIFKNYGVIMIEAVCFKSLNCLQYFLNAGYEKHGDKIWWPQSLLYEAMNYSKIFHSDQLDCVTELLRWGINNVKYSMPDYHLPQWIPKTPKHFVFFHAASKHCWKTMKLLKQLNPQYLQEHWFVEHPWDPKEALSEFLQEHWSIGHFWSLYNAQNDELAQFITDLYEERKNPPQLNILCRTKIFKQLGLNPIPKVEKLPLPQSLKHFVQCEDIEEL